MGVCVWVLGESSEAVCGVWCGCGAVRGGCEAGVWV